MLDIAANYLVLSPNVSTKQKKQNFEGGHCSFEPYYDSSRLQTAHQKAHQRKQICFCLTNLCCVVAMKNHVIKC